MKMERVPSVPLITSDPYFSLWSPADELYSADTCHWTGKVKKMMGYITIDGVKRVFMGRDETCPHLEQTGLEIRPMSSVYRFEGEGIQLEIRFLSPLLLTDMELVSRPCTYVEAAVRSTDGADHGCVLVFTMDEGFCYDGPLKKDMTGGVHRAAGFNAAWMGQIRQTPLGHSGDDVTIDWGYLYMAAQPGGEVTYNNEDDRSTLKVSFELKADPAGTESFFVAAYDDMASVMYFGDVLRGRWTKGGRTILDVIGISIQEHGAAAQKCSLFEDRLMEQAESAIGEDYVRICALAYRQAIAAHKLVEDTQGNVLFLSKECFSNGCIGTVDVSYPSVPLFLLYNTEYVKGMMRPVFKFARMPVWKFDFAPHDVGRYPYASGQVYGVKEEYGYREPHEGLVFPMYYNYPKGEDIYSLDMQMPVEECGDMLIMAAAVSIIDGNTGFVEAEMDLLEKWVSYLLRFGEDPGEQLCTDDFAGHLAHNANLAAKAILGVQAWSILLSMSGRGEEAKWYGKRAKEMAESWTKRAVQGNHTVLAFGSPESWGLKYNLVWDLLFGSHLFSEDIFAGEVSWYKEKMNKFGMPLDNRQTYTKSDWILWTACLTSDKEEMRELAAPVARYLRETKSRVPFSDWYDSCSGDEISFQNRSVQGGLFMPLLKERLLFTP